MDRFVGHDDGLKIINRFCISIGLLFCFLLWSMHNIPRAIKSTLIYLHTPMDPYVCNAKKTSVTMGIEISTIIIIY